LMKAQLQKQIPVDRTNHEFSAFNAKVIA